MTSQPLCKYESKRPGSVLCTLPRGHSGAHNTPYYTPPPFTNPHRDATTFASFLAIAGFDPKTTPVTLYIIWGMKPGPTDAPQSYHFPNANEADAFLWGVDQATGWDDYNLVSNPDARWDTERDTEFPSTRTHHRFGWIDENGIEHEAD